jgi:3-phosphoglycerate kinase
MNKLSIKDLNKNNLENKTVLLRVDLNVPIQDGIIIDSTRINSSMPTINYLLENKAKVVLLSHLGRPKGKKDKKYSLKPVYEFIKNNFNMNITFIDDCIGDNVENQIKKLDFPALVLLENVRFYPEEEKNDKEFSRKLAKLGDIFVNDAFGTAHRSHSSTVGIAEFLPTYSGLLMEKEINFLSKALNPDKPFVAIIGGAKVSTKIGVLKNLINKTDYLIIGGAMTYTFLKALGKKTGGSLVEDEYLDTAKEIIELSKNNECKLFLAKDHVVAESIDSDTIYIVEEIPDNLSSFDIGTQSIEEIKDILSKAKTIVWNGPLGVFEKPQFEKGTKEIALFLSTLKDKGITTIVGGGDSVAAIEKFNLTDKFSHVSTGGGASLEFLEGIELPGIKVIKDK